MRTPQPCRSAGFTLIELLIVIGIVGLLAAALLPNVLGAQTEGEITETRARMMFLAQAAKAYERKSDAGGYPPDQFGNLKTTIKADQVNTGIECLVIALCSAPLGRDTLADHLDWLGNTDGDKAGTSIPKLGHQEKMEVLDAWGTPIAYFCSANGGYERKQRVQLETGDVESAHAIKDPKSGKYLAPGKFQLVSAGPDTLFNTDDDVTHPPTVAE
ncbi:MAG: type II secretion system protein [Planctomycetota bacterium]